MKKSILIFLIVSLSYSVSTAQQKINWLTWEEALELHQNEKKKIFVDVYTDWCKWCDKMEKSTLSDPYVVEYVNEHYYAIRFNAEQNAEIIFNNKQYKPIKSFGKRSTHELAIEIMNGNIGYPTIVFIDENLKVIQPLQGFLDVKTFELIMTYFAGDHYKDMHWKKFVVFYQKKKAKNDYITPSQVQPPIQTVGNGRG